MDESRERPVRDVPEPGAVIVLTGGEHVSVLAAVRALRAAGHAPWVTVHERGTYAARSRACAGSVIVPMPGRDPDAFVEAVARLAREVGAAVILPGTDVATLALSKRTSRLPDHVALGAAPPDVLTSLADKRNLGTIVAAGGLAVPPEIEVRAGAVPRSLPFAFPVVVKPPVSELRGVDGITRHYAAHAASSTDGIEAALAGLPDGVAIVQPLLSGPIGSLAGVFWDGRLVAAVQAEGDRIWPTPCGSISHAVTVPLDPALVAATETMLRPTGWQGVFQLDFFRVGPDVVVIDFNPRLYTSLGHTTRAGVNLAAIWVDGLLGRGLRALPDYRLGVGYRREEGDVRALLQLLVRGPRTSALRGLRPERATEFAVSSWSDPRPLLTSVDHAIRYIKRLPRTRSTATPPDVSLGPALDAGAERAGESGS